MIGKCGDEDEAGAGVGEEFGELVFALLIDGAVGGDGFDDDEPIALGVVDKDIRGFAALGKDDVEFGEGCVVADDFLVGGIAEQEDSRAADEAWGEVFDDGADEGVLAACGKLDGRSIRKVDGFAREVAMACPEGGGCGVFEEAGDLLFVGCCADGLQQGKGFLAELVAPFGAVDRAIRLVGVFDEQAVLDELVDGLAADGFAGVGFVVDAVVVAHPVHDFGDTAQGGLCG